MDAINVSQLRTNLSEYMDKVHDDHTPMLITRAGKAAAVLISLEDYQSYFTKSYLRSIQDNAEQK